MKNGNRLPVLCFVCKEFEGHHPILITNKKLNRLKNQQFFLDPYEMEDPGQTTARKIGETGECRVPASWSRSQAGIGTPAGTSAGRKPEL